MLHLPAAGFGLWLDSVSVHADLWASLSTIKASKELKAFFYTCNQITGYFERFLHVSLSLVCVHAWKASWHNCCQLWRDSNASGKGCVSQFQLNIFLKSRFANVCQRAPPPSLVNSTKICKSTAFWAMQSLSHWIAHCLLLELSFLPSQTKAERWHSA